MGITSVPELDVFAEPLVQTSIEHAVVKDHYPISSMIESGPLEFTITGSGKNILIFLPHIYTSKLIFLKVA